MSNLISFRRTCRKRSVKSREGAKPKANGQTATVVPFVSKRQRLFAELEAITACPDCAADPSSWPPGVLQLAAELGRDHLPALVKTHPNPEVVIEGYRILKTLSGGQTR